MKYTEQRDELVKKAQGIIAGRKGAGEDLSDEDRTALADYKSQIDDLNEKITKANADAKIIAAFEKVAPGEQAVDPSGEETPGDAPKSLGEHFLKHAGDMLRDSKGSRISISAPEFKAATDSHVLTGWTAGTPFLTDYDRTVVQTFRPQTTIADLLGKGSISGNAISYLVEGAREGAFTTVAEGGAKPQMNYVNPTAVVDALKKIAGFIKLTDEFLEDAPFLKSEIDGRLLYDLAWFEEQQLLNGNGTGQNALGLLNRSGIQTEAGTSLADNPDSIFRAITKVSTASGLRADGVVINPTDYQALRLAKDGNDQYYGGGFFAGQYGQGGIPDNPPLWGLRTVVTPAIAAGTVLVGAFSQAATLYRKGGVRVEATNSHDTDFTNNLVTIRAEERVALAVRRPLGLVKVTLDDGQP